MSDRSTLVWGAILGAAVGAGVSFFLFTEKGRRMREELQPEIDEIVREAVRLGGAVQDLRRGAPARSVREASAPLPWPRRTP